MKTIIIVEIETKDDYEVWEDYDKSAEDYTNEELKKYQKEYAKGLHQGVVDYIKNGLANGIAENFFDSSYIEEYLIEDWDSLEDYGIKIKTKVKTTDLKKS